MRSTKSLLFSGLSHKLNIAAKERKIQASGARGCSTQDPTNHHEGSVISTMSCSSWSVKAKSNRKYVMSRVRSSVHKVSLPNSIELKSSPQSSKCCSAGGALLARLLGLFAFGFCQFLLLLPLCFLSFARFRGVCMVVHIVIIIRLTITRYVTRLVCTV